MAKFCKYCGTALEDGQVCTCEASQAAATPAPEAAPEAAAAAPAAAPSGFAQLMTSLKNDFLGYLRTPEATVSNALPGGIKNAAIFAGVNFLVLFFYFWKMLGGIMVNMKAPNNLGYPILPLLLTALVVTGVTIGLSALALFAVAKLSKKELPISNAFIIASYHSILPTLLLLVGILLGLISLDAQVLVVPVILIIWATFAVKDAKDHAGLNPTIAGKNLAIQVIAAVVVIAVTYLVTSALLVWCFGEITTHGIALKEFYRGVENILQLILIKS